MAKETIDKICKAEQNAEKMIEDSKIQADRIIDDAKKKAKEIIKQSEIDTMQNRANIIEESKSNFKKMLEKAKQEAKSEINLINSMAKTNEEQAINAIMLKIQN